MWVLPGLRFVNAEVWRLPERDLVVLASGLARARWTRAVTLCQQLALYESILASTRLLTEWASPAMILAVLEDLVAEGVLRRGKVMAIEEQIFRQLDCQGRWHGDPRMYGRPLQYVPPDVQVLARIGADYTEDSHG